MPSRAVLESWLPRSGNGVNNDCTPYDKNGVQSVNPSGTIQADGVGRIPPGLLAIYTNVAQY